MLSWVPKRPTELSRVTAGTLGLSLWTCLSVCLSVSCRTRTAFGIRLSRSLEFLLLAEGQKNEALHKTSTGRIRGK